MGKPALAFAPLKMTNDLEAEIVSYGFGAEPEDGGKGNGVLSTGVAEEKADDGLASPTLGHKSKRLVRTRKTLLDLTTPFSRTSVELAPAPLSIQLNR